MRSRRVSKRSPSGGEGRIENCQIGVFAAYASRYGHALVDRQHYLPKAWAEGEERRAKASVPQEIAFATKPAIAREMIARALDAGLPCAWVSADALYGNDMQLRRMLEERGQAYVLAVRSNQRLGFRKTGQNESKATSYGVARLSTSEICKLLATLLLYSKPHPSAVWAWSLWRCAHQASAAFFHRKRRNLHTQL